VGALHSIGDGPEYEKLRFTCEPPPLFVAGGDVVGLEGGEVDGTVVVAVPVELGTVGTGGAVVVDAVD
jgi:hypothetical protein